MAHSRKRVSHAQEAFYVICILMILLIGLFSYVGPWGYLEMEKTQAELAIQSARVEALEKENGVRVDNIKSLQHNDEDAIEGYARKKGYGRKGEIIQEVPQQEPDRPASDLRPPAKGK